MHCSNCGKNSFRPFRILPGNQSPDILQKYCRECKFPLSTTSKLIPLELPSIKNKKIIYLDQNIISEIMNALMPNSQNEMREELRERALNIYKKLEKLRKSQCIVCPYSWDHRRESVVEPEMFRNLLRVYTYLANNIRFVDAFTIQKNQIDKYFEALVKGQTDGISFEDDSVFEKDPNHWFWEQENMPFSYVTIEDEDLDVIEIRDKTHEEIVKIYNSWKEKPEEQIFSEESHAFTIWINRCLAHFFGLKIDNSLTQEGIAHCLNILTSVQRILSKGGMDSNPKKVMEIFESDDFVEKIPFIRYSAAMNLSLSRKVKAKQDPVQQDEWLGEITDISRISNYSIYCDAVFTDKFFAERFREDDIKKLTGSRCEFFHFKKHQEFIEYLSKIETEYAEQIEQSEKILGDLEPNLNLLGGEIS